MWGGCRSKLLVPITPPPCLSPPPPPLHPAPALQVRAKEMEVEDLRRAYEGLALENKR